MCEVSESVMEKWESRRPRDSDRAPSPSPSLCGTENRARSTERRPHANATQAPKRIHVVFELSAACACACIRLRCQSIIANAVRPRTSNSPRPRPHPCLDLFTWPRFASQRKVHFTITRRVCFPALRRALCGVGRRHDSSLSSSSTTIASPPPPVCSGGRLTGYPGCAGPDVDGAGGGAKDVGGTCTRGEVVSGGPCGAPWLVGGGRSWCGEPGCACWC